MDYKLKYFKYKVKYNQLKDNLNNKNDNDTEKNRKSKQSGGGNNLFYNIANVATCTLAQFPLDFKGNLDRIKKSIEIAKKRGCKYRLGPELEICGYECGDHFYEIDTIKSSWDSILDLLKTDLTNDILVDTSMPILHNGHRYNCRIFILNKKIILIRPKIYLAYAGNYKEPRWFKSWPINNRIEEFILPKEIQDITNQFKVPFGFGIIQAKDISIASEICSELYVVNPPNISLSLEGIDIISNGSGSHFQQGKYERTPNFIASTTQKNGGVYMYSNHIGYNGSNLLFNGNCMIYMNGKLLNISKFLTYNDVEVVSSKIPIDIIRNYKSTSTYLNTDNKNENHKISRIYIDFNLTTMSNSYDNDIKLPKINYNFELISAPARYLWDYLIKNKSSGFILEYSNDINSVSVALIIYFMCDQIIKILRSTDEDLKQTIKDKLINNKIITDITINLTTKQLVNKVLTIYINKPKKEIKDIETNFITTIGANYIEEKDISKMINIKTIKKLGSVNSDELILGLNKINKDYQLNPIGSISRKELIDLIRYFANEYESFNILNEILETIIIDTKENEIKIGLTYNDIYEIGKLRFGENIGPESIFLKLYNDKKGKEIEYINNISKTKEKGNATPEIISNIVIEFFKLYIKNHNDNEPIIDIIHLTDYNPDIGYSIRPNLYSNLETQIEKLKEMIKK